MNNQNLYRKGTIIKLNTCDEWNNLYGIIDFVDIENKTLVVFSIQMPYFTYKVDFHNADEVLEIIAV